MGTELGVVLIRKGSRTSLKLVEPGSTAITRKVLN